MAWRRGLLRTGAAAFFLVTGCHLIADFDTSGLEEPPVPPPPDLTAFDNGCFAGYGAAEGVIRFDAVTSGLITGDGRGLFTDPLVRWSVAETARDEETVQLSLVVSASESYSIEATANDAGQLALSGLPGATPELDLPPCADTVGLYDHTTRSVSLWDAHLDDPPDRSFVLDPAPGARTVRPRAVAGDWDGDGIDTPGIWDTDNRTFYLAGTEEPSELTVLALDPTRFPPTLFDGPLLPFAGDWNGDGSDGVGLFAEDTSEIYLIEGVGAVPTRLTLELTGAATGNLRPIAGDWDGDGTDTLAIYQRRARILDVWLAMRAGASDRQCLLEGTLDNQTLPIAGDWDGDGTDGVGLYDGGADSLPGRQVRLYSVSAGGCSRLAEFPLGPRPTADEALLPLAGNWDGR